MGIERTFRWIAIVSFTICLTIAVGTGFARWTMANTTRIYTDSHLRDARSPAYARDRAVADSFWDRQETPR